MRALSGYYPSEYSEELQNSLPSREDPAEWPDLEPGEHNFDYWQSVGVGIILPDGDGYRLEGDEPEKWDRCWNPRDEKGTSFTDLDTFATYWFALRGERPIGIEFYTIEKNIPFEITQEENIRFSKRKESSPS